MATRTHLWPIFMEYSMGIAPRYAGRVLVIKKLEFRGLNGQFDVKKVNFKRLIAKIGH